MAAGVMVADQDAQFPVSIGDAQPYGHGFNQFSAQPFMPFMGRPQPYTRAVIQPQPPALGLLLRDFQPFTSPNAVNALLIHMPAIPPKQGCDPAITISTEPFRQMDDGCCQVIFIFTKHLRLALS